MSLLTLVQNAADEIGIVRPTSVVSSTDQQVIRLFGLAQREGKSLWRDYTWQALQSEKTFTATATTVQSGVIPTDFGYFIDETFFNRSQKREVYGPLTPQEWQFNQSVVSTVIIESFRRRGNDLMLTPTPTAGETYAFEYVSKYWCQSSGGTAQVQWAADTDTGILDEDLMTLGLIWRFKQAQGFDYAESYRNYQMAVAQMVARDGGKRRLNAGKVGGSRPRAPFAQDGNWNLS